MMMMMMTRAVVVLMLVCGVLMSEMMEGVEAQSWRGRGGSRRGGGAGGLVDTILDNVNTIVDDARSGGGAQDIIEDVGDLVDDILRGVGLDGRVPDLVRDIIDDSAQIVEDAQDDETNVDEILEDSQNLVDNILDNVGGRRPAEGGGGAVGNLVNDILDNVGQVVESATSGTVDGILDSVNGLVDGILLDVDTIVDGATYGGGRGASAGIDIARSAVNNAFDNTQRILGRDVDRYFELVDPLEDVMDSESNEEEDADAEEMGEEVLPVFDAEEAEEEDDDDDDESLAPSFVSMAFDIAFDTENEFVPWRSRTIVRMALENAQQDTNDALARAREVTPNAPSRLSMLSVESEYMEARMLDGVDGSTWSLEGLAKNGASQLMSSTTIDFEGETWQMYADFFGDDEWLHNHILSGINGYDENNKVRSALVAKTVIDAIGITTALDFVENALGAFELEGASELSVELYAMESIYGAWTAYYGNGVGCQSPYSTAELLSLEFGHVGDVNDMVARNVVATLQELQSLSAGEISVRDVVKKLVTMRNVIIEAARITYLRAMVKHARKMDLAGADGDADLLRTEQAKAIASLWVIAPLTAQIDATNTDTMLQIFDLGTTYEVDSYVSVVGQVTQALTLSMLEQACGPSDAACLIPPAEFGTYTPAVSEPLSGGLDTCDA